MNEKQRHTCFDEAGNRANPGSYLVMRRFNGAPKFLTGTGTKDEAWQDDRRLADHFCWSEAQDQINHLDRYGQVSHCLKL